MCSVYVILSPVSDLLTTVVCGGWDVYHHATPCCSRNTLWETHGEPLGWGRDWILLAVGFSVCFQFVQSQKKYPYKSILLIVTSCNFNKYQVDRTNTYYSRWQTFMSAPDLTCLQLMSCPASAQTLLPNWRVVPIVCLFLQLKKKCKLFEIMDLSLTVNWFICCFL
jgi:hypothetical protein